MATMVTPTRINFAFILTWSVLLILLTQPKAHMRCEVAAESDQRYLSYKMTLSLYNVVLAVKHLLYRPVSFLQ
jgi:hypothetical protein